jgi:hypothetical protein
VSLLLDFSNISEALLYLVSGSQPCGESHHVSSKLWHALKRQHGVITQMTIIRIHTATKTSISESYHILVAGLEEEVVYSYLQLLTTNVLLNRCKC